MSLSITRYIMPSRRWRLIAAIILCSVLATICGEGIADAEEVNPKIAALQVQPDAQARNDEQPALSVGPAEWVIAGIGMLGLWVFFASRWHRLERVPRRPHLINPAMGFILVALLFLSSIIGMATARSLFGLDGDIQQQDNPVRAYAIIAGGTHLAQLLVLLVLVVLWSKSRRPMHETRPRPLHAAVLGLGGLILVWPIVMLASFITSAVVLLITGKPVDPIAHDTLALFVEHERNGWTVLLIALVVLAAPLVEEVMYRGVIQESLGQLGLSRWTAIVLTSIFFAMMHLPAIELHALGTLFVLSLGFGWIYEKTGRLAAPIAMHAAFNTGNLALVMMGFGS